MIGSRKRLSEIHKRMINELIDMGAYERGDMYINSLDYKSLNEELEKQRNIETKQRRLKETDGRKYILFWNHMKELRIREVESLKSIRLGGYYKRFQSKRADEVFKKYPTNDLTFEQASLIALKAIKTNKKYIYHGKEEKQNG